MLVSRNLSVIRKFCTSFHILIKTRIMRSWCTKEEMNMPVMVFRSRWRHCQGFLALLEIIVTIILKELTSRCKTRNAWQHKTLFVTSVNQADSNIQQVATANQKKEKPSQPPRILRRSDKHGKNDSSGRSHVILLDKLSRPSMRMVNPRKPDGMFLFRKQNYKIIVNIGPISSVMYRMPIILDLGAGSNFLQEDQLALFLITQAVHDPETTNIYASNARPLRIFGSVKHYVQIGRTTELVEFLVCKRLAVPTILRCDFCNQFGACNYAKTVIVESTDAPTVPIV